MSLTYSMGNDQTSGNFQVDYSADGTDQNPVTAGGANQTGSVSTSLVIDGSESGTKKGTKISIDYIKNSNPKNFSDTMKDKTQPKTSTLTTDLSVFMDPTAKTWTINYTALTDAPSGISEEKDTENIEVIIGPDGQ